MENTKKSFGEIWAELTSEQTEYLKGYIDRQRQDAVKHYQAEQLRIASVSQQSELLAFEQWVDKNTTTALKDGIKLALENYKKANCG